MSQKSPERWVRAAVFCEACLLLLAGFALAGFEIAEATPSMRIYSIIVLTAIAMGLRNATVRRLAVPDLTTTVLTLTVTGIAADSSLAAGNNPRFGYRLASIFLMLLEQRLVQRYYDSDLLRPYFLAACWFWCQSRSSRRKPKRILR